MLSELEALRRIVVYRPESAGEVVFAAEWDLCCLAVRATSSESTATIKEAAGAATAVRDEAEPRHE